MHILETDASHWDIFLSKSTSFYTLSTLIHKQIFGTDCCIHTLTIYIGQENYVYHFDLPENFDILLTHSPIKNIHLVIDKKNPQFEHLDRTVRFMRDVYAFPVSITVTRTQIIPIPSDSA